MGNKVTGHEVRRGDKKNKKNCPKGPILNNLKVIAISNDTKKPNISS